MPLLPSPSARSFRLLRLGALVLPLAIGACVTPDRQYTATGAAVGSVAGAILGHQVDGDHGRYAGAAAGALIGAAIGNNADAIRNQRRYSAPESAYDYPSRGYRYSRYDDRYDDTYEDRGYAPYRPPDYRY